MKLDAVGFGSLNLDEFWEVPADFLICHNLKPGEEYVRDRRWFAAVYPDLQSQAVLMAADPGGSAANMIAALKRMGFTTGFFGVTGGRDAVSMRLHELGEPEDLRVKEVGVPAGRCLALINRDDPARDRALVILPNANDLAVVDETDAAYFQRTRWIHMTSFVSRDPLKAQIQLLQELGPEVRLSFDPGAVYSVLGARELGPILGRAEVLFVTEEELAALTSLSDEGRAVENLLAMGVGIVVIKRGARGLAAFEKGVSYRLPAVAPAEIRDRTGAGDVAAAGFLAGLLLSLGLDASLDLAARAASMSIEGYGRTRYPDADFLSSFLSGLRCSPKPS